MKDHGKSSPVKSCSEMTAMLNSGAGLLVRYEDIPQYHHVFRNIDPLLNFINYEFGTASTVHLYHATRNASRALMPHTDPYDVIVAQIAGTKHWKVCAPRPYEILKSLEERGNASPNPNSTEIQQVTLNTAQLAQAQEILRERQDGCTNYDDKDVDNMDCTTIQMAPGTVMYMPKGMVHYAISEDQGSSHITISVKRNGIAWADALIFGVDHAANIVDHPLFQDA